MQPDVRVILVGRTGLDAKLRLDPKIELIRVKTPLEAIGELADPIEEYSPRQSVVVVGTGVYPPREGEPVGEPDFSLHGAVAMDFARALQLVDPQVRIIKSIVPGTPESRISDSPDERYYHELVHMDDPSEKIRAVIRGAWRDPGAKDPGAKDVGAVAVTPPPLPTKGGAAEPKPRSEPRHVPQTKPVADGPARPAVDKVDKIEPARTEGASMTPASTMREESSTGGGVSAGAVGVPHRAAGLASESPLLRPVEVMAPEPPVTISGDEVGDLALVRQNMKGGDVSALALDLIRNRLGDPSVRLAPTDGGGVEVAADGRSFGWLAADRTPASALGTHALWLASWLRMSEQQAQLREAAFTDYLTGAWNRRYFDKYLGAVIDRARASRQTVLLLVFDIDNFKSYNDRYGHQASDEILIEAARMMKSVVRPSDRVCRIGGDEFAVIFHEPTGPRVPGSQPPTTVAEIAARFQEQIRQKRFPKLGIEAPGTLTISGGLASFPWDAYSAGDLLKKADDLAGESKRAGKNAITFGPKALEG